MSRRIPILGEVMHYQEGLIIRRRGAVGMPAEIVLEGGTHNPWEDAMIDRIDRERREEQIGIGLDQFGREHNGHGFAEAMCQGRWVGWGDGLRPLDPKDTAGVGVLVCESHSIEDQPEPMPDYSQFHYERKVRLVKLSDHLERYATWHEDDDQALPKHIGMRRISKYDEERSRRKAEAGGHNVSLVVESKRFGSRKEAEAYSRGCGDQRPSVFRAYDVNGWKLSYRGYGHHGRYCSGSKVFLTEEKARVYQREFTEAWRNIPSPIAEWVDGKWRDVRPLVEGFRFSVEPNWVEAGWTGHVARSKKGESSHQCWKVATRGQKARHQWARHERQIKASWQERESGSVGEVLAEELAEFHDLCEIDRELYQIDLDLCEYGPTMFDDSGKAYEDEQEEFDWEEVWEAEYYRMEQHAMWYERQTFHFTERNSWEIEMWSRAQAREDQTRDQSAA